MSWPPMRMAAAHFPAADRAALICTVRPSSVEFNVTVIAPDARMFARASDMRPSAVMDENGSSSPGAADAAGSADVVAAGTTSGADESPVLSQPASAAVAAVAAHRATTILLLADIGRPPSEIHTCARVGRTTPTPGLYGKHNRGR